MIPYDDGVYRSALALEIEDDGPTFMWTGNPADPITVLVDGEDKLRHAPLRESTVVLLNEKSRGYVDFGVLGFFQGFFEAYCRGWWKGFQDGKSDAEIIDWLEQEFKEES